jgi:hypothetical protein
MLEIMIVGAIVCGWFTLLFLRGCRAQEIRISESELRILLAENSFD